MSNGQTGPDEGFTRIHVLHRDNVSVCFQQHVLPHLLLARLFPEAPKMLGLA